MLTSLQNPLVKQMRKLHRAQDRYEQALFLLEGTHLLEEACTALYPLETVCYTQAWQVHHPMLREQIAEQAQRLELVSEDVLRAIATTVNPDGVVATARRAVGDRGSLDGLASSTDSTVPLGVALETLQDPGNLGTIIRTAAAASVDRLWLSANSVDLTHPKVLRASAGQWFRLPMTVSDHLEADLRTLKLQDIQIIATLPTAELTYWQVDFTQPTVILLGNEGAGLSPQLAAMATAAVKIPVASAVESLNVAVVAALILYEARRQREAA